MDPVDTTLGLSALQLDNDPVTPSIPAGGQRLTLMDLPVEIHLQIIAHCALHPHRLSKPEWTPEGRHVARDSRKLLGGSVRDLTQVNNYFRAITAPTMFESICVSDNSTATLEDKLRDTHEQLVRVPTYNYLHYMNKLTVSLGRTPNPHKSCAGQDFVELLDYMHWPSTVRFVLESQHPIYTVLNDAHRLLLKWRRTGFELLAFKPRQLELSARWGTHRWDFQFLTWPYLNLERIWLDFDTDHLKPQTLQLDRLRNLEYVMHRSHPMAFPTSHIELENFNGFTASDSHDRSLLVQLSKTMKQVKHLALCGLLRGPVTEIVPLLEGMLSLEQLDITDQQAIPDDDVTNISKMWHPIHEIDWAMKHSHLIRNHPNNVDRVEAALLFFGTLPQLSRICFVSDQVGTFYKADRDPETGVLRGVNAAVQITKEPFRYLRPGNCQSVWRCGFPNRLKLKLWDRTEQSNWCTSEAAFWLDRRWLATGDESLVPRHLQYDVAERAVFGVMDPEHAEKIARLHAKIDERIRQKKERQQLDLYIRNLDASERKEKHEAQKLREPPGRREVPVHAHWQVTPDQLATAPPAV